MLNGRIPAPDETPIKKTDRRICFSRAATPRHGAEQGYHIARLY